MSTSYWRRQSDFYRNKGAEFLGAVVRLNVSVQTPLTLNQIRDVFLNSNLLPDEWAPERRSDLKLWLDTMTEAGRTTRVNKLVPNLDGGFEFDVETHAGHFVKRLELESASDKPVAHTVIKMDKKLVPVFDDRGQLVRDKDGKPVMKQSSVEADDGIRVLLVRAKGSYEDDVLGTNTWELVVERPDGTEYTNDSDIPVEYYPFLRTVWTRWSDKRRGNYQTKEVRDIVNDIINRFLHLDTFDTATHFAPKDKLNQLRELSDRLRDLHPGIRLHLWELVRWDGDDQRNDMVDAVSHGLIDTLQLELKRLIEEMKKRDGDDSTRESTWNTRREKLLEIRNKCRDYNRIKLMNEQTFQDMFEEAKQLLLANQ
jgi:hypothetical protein